MRYCDLCNYIFFDEILYSIRYDNNGLLVRLFIVEKHHMMLSTSTNDWRFNYDFLNTAIENIEIFSH